MKLEIHTELQCFKNLTEEWCDLLQHTDTYSIFQTPAFIHTWWEIYGEGQLYVISVRDSENKLLAVCPFHIIQKNQKKVLTFISDKDVTDYQDFIIHKEHSAEIYILISDHIQSALQEGTFDTIELFSIPDASPTRTHFLPTAVERIETEQDVCPIIELPHHWDAYLDSLERKQRHEVRRKMKKLTENLEHAFIKVEKLSEYPEAVKTFITLHKASSAEKESFWDKKREEFFTLFVKRAEEHGWLRLFFLQVENKPAATMLIFEHTHEYQLYNSGFMPDQYREYSTGQVLMSYTIQDAILQGMTRFNFLRGSEPYKFRLGGKAEAVWDLIFS